MRPQPPFMLVLFCFTCLSLGFGLESFISDFVPYYFSRTKTLTSIVDNIPPEAEFIIVDGIVFSREEFILFLELLSFFVDPTLLNLGYSIPHYIYMEFPEECLQDLNSLQDFDSYFIRNKPKLLDIKFFRPR